MQTPERKIPQFSTPEDLRAIYVNLVRITHSPGEMVFDFSLFLPGDSKAEISNRILMSPIGAKLFYMALGDNLRRYESVFGEINLPGDSELARSLFKGIQPPENPEGND
jgi:hypothetical protein